MPLQATDTIHAQADTAATAQPLQAVDSAAILRQQELAAAGHPTWAPVPLGRSNELMAPYSHADSILYHTSPPGWFAGIDAPLRHANASGNSGVLALLIGLFVLIGFNMKNLRRLFRTLPQKLWSVRRRSNAFDDTTSNESRSFLLLLITLFVCGGILLYRAMGVAVTPSGIFYNVAMLAAAAAGLYIFQLAACSLVGYVFTDTAGATAWRRGLNASAALLGVALVLPALLALFYPSTAAAMVWTGGILYIMSRLAFIAKGFRIFYKNFLSLLYFILYLCTLEIIPVIVLYVSATEICRTF